MAVHQPDKMKDELKQGFDVFLAAWGYRMTDLTDMEICQLIQSFYWDQLISHLASAAQSGRIVLSPGIRR